MTTKKFQRTWASPFMLTYVGKFRKPVYEQVYVWSNGETAYLGSFYEDEGRRGFDPAEAIFFTQRRVNAEFKRRAFVTGDDKGFGARVVDGTKVDPKLATRGKTLVEYIFDKARKCDLTEEQASELVTQLMRGYGLQG